MNIEALNDMADYLFKGDFGGRTFSMGCYHDCVLGHYVAREAKRSGIAMDKVEEAYKVSGVSSKVFGISQPTEEWQFAFGAQWGNDHRAAADRLRYLARHGGAPNRAVWDSFRTHPQPVVGGGKVEESKDGELTYSGGYGPVKYGTSGENCVVTGNLDSGHCARVERELAHAS